MNPIIQDNDINEEAARNYLNDCYSGLELLPNIPEKFSRLTAATILNVSLPTIDRMLNDKQIELTKQSLLNYIMQNMLVNYPLALDDEEKMNGKARELSPEEMEEYKKSFSDIEESIHNLDAGKDDSPSLFSDEDLRQE